MLLNEFLKAHRKMEEQEATIAQLKATSIKQEAVNAEQQKAMETLAAPLKQQAAQIQRMGAQLALGLEANEFST